VENIKIPEVYFYLPVRSRAPNMKLKNNHCLSKPKLYRVLNDRGSLRSFKVIHVFPVQKAIIKPPSWSNH